MNITVRLMDNKDYNAVHQIDILTQRQYLGTNFDDMNEEEQEKHLVSRKSEFAINVNTGYCFVSENDETIIGFLLAYETLPLHGTLYVSYIAIDPAYQGKGIGILMYRKLIEKAKQSDIKKICALINLDNPQSLKLCEKLGFKIQDRKEAIIEL